MSDQPPAARVSLKPSASFALATIKKYPGPLIGLAAIVTILQFMSSVGSGALENVLVSCLDAQSPGQVNSCDLAISEATGPLAWALLFSVLATVAVIGVQRAALDSTLGIAPSMRSLLSTRYLGRYLLYLVASTVLMAIGFVLCLLPGLIVAYFLQFGAYAVLDRGAGVGQAMRTSMALVRAHPGPAFSLLMIHVAGLLLGSLFMGIPTLVVLPFVTLLTAHAYRDFHFAPQG